MDFIALILLIVWACFFGIDTLFHLYGIWDKNSKKKNDKEDDDNE